MVNFENLIKYENENTSLDFKAIQYKKSQHEDLIKDIMSMANADVENDRHIIIGVDHKASGERKILNIKNIKKGDFIDSSRYQQIITENIEPEIKLDYSPYKYEGKLLGILKISNCFDQPYVMKKEFGNLKMGDSFIRKGTHISRMMRRDLDAIYEKKLKKDKFDGKIQLSFSGYSSGQEIELMVASDIKLPSQRAAEKIKKIIKEKKPLAKMKTQGTAFTEISAILESQFAKTLRITANPLAPIPYEQRTLEELQKNLKEVDQTYHDDDCYELFELNSHKINICILNEGQKYIEDASIQLQINKIEGLLIADTVYEKPKNGINRLVSAGVPSYESMNYPKVDYTKSSIVVYQTIGDVKHRLPIDAFKVPIRIVFFGQLVGKAIEIKCKIFGKNLIEPLNEILRIKAISPIKGQ